MDTMSDWECPKCTTVNKVNLGDLNDTSALDVESVKCEHIGWLVEEDKVFYHGKKPEDAAVENGHEPCPHCDGTGIKEKKT